MKALNKESILRKPDEDGLRIMGVFSENRPEYTKLEITCLGDSFTILPIFTRYSLDQVEQIIEQTQITTLAVSQQTIIKVKDMILEGRIKSINTLISFDPVT